MAEDLLNRFKNFASRSKSAFASFYDRMKNDRGFISGKKMWTTDDDNFIAATRNRITVNVLGNQCHSVANSYDDFPFVFTVGDPKIDGELDDFFKIEGNRFASSEALLGQVTFGLGVLALGSDQDAEGNEVPVVYCVRDPERVMLDPDATSLSGDDAVEGALIDYRSREWVRIHIGEEYVPDKNAKMVVTSASCADKVPIVTYYYLETDGCHVATFVNERQVMQESDTVLPIHRIPIYPAWGEQTWDENDKETYCGLVSKAKDVQRIVNYAMTALAERLALSPKPQWTGYLESFKGLDKYYKRAGSGVNPVLPANRLANDGKTVLDLPKRLDNTVQFGDLQGITTGTLDMLTSITGVDSKGLASAENDITATAVLYTSKVFQNNVKHYFAHLRTTMKSLGDDLLVLMGHPDKKVEVAQGPSAYMEMQTARAELNALLPVVEPSQKRALVNAILRTHPDNRVLAQLYIDLNSAPEPTPMEEEMQQVAMQMREKIEQDRQEIASLTAQLEEDSNQIQDTDTDKVFELKKMELEHVFSQEDAILKARLDAGLDGDRVAVEAERERVRTASEAERAAIRAESDRMKLETQAAKDAMELDKKAAIDGMDLANKVFGGE